MSNKILKIETYNILHKFIISYNILANKTFCKLINFTYRLDHYDYCDNNFFCFNCFKIKMNTDSYTVIIFFAPGSEEYKKHKIIKLNYRHYEDAKNVVDKIIEIKKYNN